MIHVIATIEVAEGRRDDLLNEFRKLAPVVRAEAGCIEYGAAVDLETDIPRQAPIRRDGLTVIEKWESLDALKAHLAAPHMAEYRETVVDLVAGASLQILKPA